MSLIKKKNTEKKATPAKPKANRKRSERLSLFLTAEEKNLITDTADEAGISRTDLIMKAVREQQPIVITGVGELMLELNRQANNLNQLARKVNSYNRVSNAEIQKTIIACRMAYKELIRFITEWDMKLKRMEERRSDRESEGSEGYERAPKGD